MTKIGLNGIYAACIIGLMAASSVAAYAQTPVKGGTFTVATNGQEPACIDPLINATAGVIVSRNYSDSLVWQTEDGKFLPWLAESWTISDVGKVYSF